MGTARGALASGTTDTRMPVRSPIASGIIEAMSDAPPTRRRWYQFGIGTIFLLVALFAAFLAYQANWIRERHAFLVEENQKLAADNIAPEPPTDDTPAPGLLWLLGEKGVDAVIFWFDGKNSDWSFYDGEQVARTERAMKLFPEAEIAAWGIEYEDASRQHGTFRAMKLSRDFQKPSAH
jgi:hypothetical protein